MNIRLVLALFVALFIAPKLHATLPFNSYCLRKLKALPNHLVVSGDLATTLVQPAISYIHAVANTAAVNNSRKDLLSRVLAIQPEIARLDYQLELAEEELGKILSGHEEAKKLAEAKCQRLREEIQKLQIELAHLVKNEPLEATPHPVDRQVTTGGDPLLALEFLPGSAHEKNPYTFALDTDKVEIHENEGGRPGYWFEAVEVEGGEIEALFKAAKLYGMGEMSEVGPIVTFHGKRQLKIELNNPEFPELEAGQSYDAEFRVSRHNDDIFTLEIVLYLPESLH